MLAESDGKGSAADVATSGLKPGALSVTKDAYSFFLGLKTLLKAAEVHR